MKIAFFTESSFVGRYDRSYTNARTEVAWMIALDAYHYPIGWNEFLMHYDLRIIIIPKKNPQHAIKYIQRLREEGGKIAIMQEGPNWLWQDWDIPTQVEYYNALCSADYIFAHNWSDALYYKGLTNHPRVSVLPSLMIEDTVKHLKGMHGEKGVIIGGNFTSWYGGFDSMIVAQQFDQEITAPSMGRRQPREEQLVQHLPYMQWTEWIEQLSKFKYGVHMMRTHAAGTFALNCAYLGIPCIGYKGLDTQTLLHPNLTVDSLSEARELAKYLKNNPEFYTQQSALCTERYDRYYSEEEFKRIFYKNLE